jgi:hypothetical protein
VLIPVFRLGKNAGNSGNASKFRREGFCLSFQFIGGLSSKMTDHDRRAHMTRRQLPRLQLMREAAPFILNEETVVTRRARWGFTRSPVVL